jgi:diadenosine tetraphosphate (Ap4A) HIT family hydrolase
MTCGLVKRESGPVLWRVEFCSILRARAGDDSGSCRVILNQHAREMTDLSQAERERAERAVLA